MRTLFFILLSLTAYAQKEQMVLRIDPTRLEEIVVKNGNRMLCPVPDGNGDLIVGKEVLQDTSFAAVWKTLLSISEEIPYVPFLDDEKQQEAKYAELEAQGKLLKIAGDRIQYDSKFIDIPVKTSKDTLKVKGQIKIK
jgi:hypothetical protein